MAFIRRINKGNATYLAKVESYREDGKVKQRVLEYIGKEENGQAVIKTDINKIGVESVKRYADIRVLLQLAKELKLNYLLGEHYKSIISVVVAHLLCKGSILKMASWIDQTSLSEELGEKSLSTKQLYESLDYLNEVSFSKLESSLTDHWSKIVPNDSTSFVLDVTDTYYSGRQTDDKARKGKDGKVSKLLQIGLVVSFQNGFPILHKTYGGNISNIKIFTDLLANMAASGLKSIVMDRGFYSEENVTEAEKLGMRVIVGMKQTLGIKKKYLDTIDRDDIYIRKNQIVLKDTTVYAKEFPFLHGTLIVLYNPKLEVLKRDHLLTGEESMKQLKYLGFSLIYHNTKYKPEIVVRKYFDKDIVERSFKSLKGDIQLHPIRLWLPERVEAHVKLCYLSLCLMALIQFKCRKLNLSASKVLEELQYVYKVKLQHAKTKKHWEKVVTLTNQQKNILKALKCSV